MNHLSLIQLIVSVLIQGLNLVIILIYQSLSLHINTIPLALEVLNDFVLELKSNVEIWNNQISSGEMKVYFFNWDEFQDLANTIHNLKFVLKLLNQSNIPEDCFDFVKANQNSSKTKVLRRFAKTCTELKSSILQIWSKWLSKRLSIIQFLMSSFLAIGGS